MPARRVSRRPFPVSPRSIAGPPRRPLAFHSRARPKNLVHRGIAWSDVEQFCNPTSIKPGVGGRNAGSQSVADTGLLERLPAGTGGPQGEGRTLALYLKPVSKMMRCEQCGARCSQIHETSIRRVRDLPLFEHRVVLHVPRRRVWREHCKGPSPEKLDWLGRYQRVTERFAKACERRLQAASVQAVAALYDSGRHTVTKVTVAPRWSSIRSAVKYRGSARGARARRLVPSSSRFRKASPNASKPSPST